MRQLRRIYCVTIVQYGILGIIIIAVRGMASALKNFPFV